MNKMMPTDKKFYTKNHEAVSLNQQVSQETQYLLSTLANRKSLQKRMGQSHSDRILTPEEWDKLKIF